MSRIFYEASQSKFFWSIVAGTFSLLMLGLCTISGGQSNFANEIGQMGTTDDDAFTQLANGTGNEIICCITLGKNQ